MSGWSGVAFGCGRFGRGASVAGGLFWKGVEEAGLAAGGSYLVDV